MSIKEKPTLNLYFPKKGPVQPKGFDTTVLDSRVTIVIKGKINRLESDSSQWDPGKRVGLDITGCEILAPAKKVSITDALTAARKKV